MELFADNSRLIRGLKRARYKMRAWGQKVRAIGMSMMGVGSALAAPLAGAAKIFSSTGDRLGKLSKRTGVSVEALSELQFAAERSGASLDAVEKGVRRMQRSIYDLERGLSTSQDAFGDLGLSLRDLQGLSPEDQFMRIARRLRGVEDASKKAAIAQQLFGRSGTELLPLLDSVEGLREKAREMGLTIGGKSARAAERFTDVMGDVWRMVKRAGYEMGAALAPALEDVALRITEALKHVTEFISENHEMVIVVGQVAAGLLAGGAAMVALGTAISGLGSVLGMVASGLGLVGTLIGALLSPIGLVVAGLTALGTWFFRSSEAGQKAMNWLGDKFGELAGWASEALGVIKDAMAAGEYKAAARVMWAAIKQVWAKGSYEVKRIWENLSHAVLKAWQNTVWALKAAWNEWTAFLKKGQEKTTDWLARRMVEVWGVFDKSIDVDAVKSGLDRIHRGRMGDIEDERRAALGAVDEEWAARRKAAEKAHKDQLGKLKDEAQAARSEYHDALESARQKAAEGAAGSVASGVKSGRMAAAQLGAGGAAGGGGISSSVRGTFSAVGAWGLGTGNPIERTAKASEETAENTKEMKRDMKTQGMRYE